VSGVVELHVISDATGATAKRLVQALEAQFPEQSFEDIVHPRVETPRETSASFCASSSRGTVSFNDVPLSASPSITISESII